MREAKQALRARALEARDAMPGRDAAGRAVAARVRALPDWSGAGTVSVYVGVGSEVPTLDLIDELLARGSAVAVPVVLRGEPDLRLVRIRSRAELEPARFGLLEPGPALREAADRRVPPEAVDLFLVPGVAFDPAGGRVGYGRGYYDRLLARARPDAGIVALAFECQVFDRVPVGDTDVRIPRLATERALYQAGPGAA